MKRPDPQTLKFKVKAAGIASGQTTAQSVESFKSDYSKHLSYVTLISLKLIQNISVNMVMMPQMCSQRGTLCLTFSFLYSVDSHIRLIYLKIEKSF